MIAATGEQLWTARYDTTATDILAVQVLVAEAVTTNVAGRLLPSDRTRMARRLTTDPTAYDHYLRGNRLLWKETEDAVLGAIGHYDAALAVDPRFSSALGRLAYAYGLSLNWAYRPSGLPIDSVLARGLATADGAIGLDSTNSDAWLGRAMVLFFRGGPSDLALAPEAFRRAIVLDPSNDAAHNWYGVVLRRLGQFDEAAQEYFRAVAINPQRVQSLSDLGFIAYSRRAYAEAARFYERSRAIDSSISSTHSLLAYVHSAAGDRESALRDARRGLAVATESERLRITATLAEMEWRAGNRATAQTLYNEALVLLRTPQGQLPATISVRNAWQVALAALTIGEKSTALDILERARPRGPWLWSYLVFPGFDSIRGDPAFRRIVNEARPLGGKDPF